MGTRSDELEMTDQDETGRRPPSADPWDEDTADPGTQRSSSKLWATGQAAPVPETMTVVEPQVDAEQAPDPDEQADQLVVEIERTRVEMGSTLEEVGQRLDPTRLADQAKETVREATVGRVEDMVDQATSTAQETGGNIVRTVRENPVPAALAGIGLFMLWQRFNQGQSSRQGTYRSTGATPYARYGVYDASGYGTAGVGYEGSGGGVQQTAGDLASRAQQTAGDVASGVAQAAGSAASTVQQTAGSAASTVQQTAGEVAERAGQAVQTAGTTAGDLASQVQWQARRTQDQLSRVIDQNPLAAGLAAVAVGAVVGAAIPTTQQERQVLGPASSTLAERAAETLEQASDQVQQSVDAP